MSEPTSPGILFHHGDVEIGAEYLAPKLGLSPQRLIEEMRRGIVYGLVETGVDEDEGRTRLTFRYRARAWSVVLEPDGRLIDVAQPSPRPNSVDPASKQLAPRNTLYGRSHEVSTKKLRENKPRKGNSDERYPQKAK